MPHYSCLLFSSELAHIAGATGVNRPFSYSEKNQNRTVFCYILSNFRMCTIVKEALTQLDRTSCMKMYKNNARSSLFCRIAKRSIVEILAISEKFKGRIAKKQIASFKLSNSKKQIMELYINFLKDLKPTICSRIKALTNNIQPLHFC